MPEPGTLTGSASAPAKLNLALHVTGRRDDGYHTLESLVVFCPTIADELKIEEAEADSLAVDGPFADGVPRDGRNIVLKALALARQESERTGDALPPLSLSLTKTLPHAAGIGGGSADAAALLRHIADARPDLRSSLKRRAIELGADVPMCLEARPAIATGIGETLEGVELPEPPAIVLVNPGRTVPTPAIFAALERRDNAGLPSLPEGGLRSAHALLDWLAGTRNDLQRTAALIEPSIGECLRALDGAGADFVRMSGSGATVFGLFVDRDEARQAVDRLRQTRPDWWVRIDGGPGSG